MLLAALPPKPINMAGPPSWISAAPAGIDLFSEWSAEILPTPPANIIGLW